MFSFIIWLFASIGLTQIVTISFLFKALREKFKSINVYLGKLISCPQCFGFWSGSFVYLYMSNMNLEKEFILFGFISSFFNYLTYLLMKDLINKHD